jgi:hypothetical protein
MWAAGLKSNDIGARLGIRPAYARVLVQRARMRGDPRAVARHADAMMHFTLAPDADMGKALSAEAAKRGLSVHALTGLIVKTICDDNLFSAVLEVE